MPEQTIIDNPSYNEWNTVLNNSTEGNFQQTFEYGEVMRRAIPRTKVVRLLAIDKGSPVGILQGLYRTRFGFGGNLIVGGISGGAPLTCVTEQDKRLQITQYLLEALQDHATTNRIIGSRVYWTERWGMQEIFKRLNYSFASAVDAFIVDLQKSREELWSSISHNLRRKVKQAMKAEVEVVEAKDHDDLLSFYRMVKESGERQEFGPPPISEFEAVWDIYRPKKMAWIFLAKLKGKDVAGTQVIAHLKTLQATSAGSLKEGWSARPTDYLHWKIMEWAQEQGFSYYSLGGALTPGLIRWKKGFRGKQEKICKYDKVFFPRLKKIFGRAYARTRWVVL